MRQVAIAPWNAPDRLPGSGILVLPIPSSTGLLVGVIFLAERFPGFLVPSPILSAMQPSPVGQGFPLYAQQQPYYPNQPGSSSTGTNYGNANTRTQQRPASRIGYHPQQQQFQGGMSSYLNQGQSYSYRIAGSSVHAVPHPVPSTPSPMPLPSDPDIPPPLQRSTNWPIIIRIGDEEEPESGTIEETSTPPSLPSAHEDKTS